MGHQSYLDSAGSLTLSPSSLSETQVIPTPSLQSMGQLSESLSDSMSGFQLSASVRHRARVFIDVQVQTSLETHEKGIQAGKLERHAFPPKVPEEHNARPPFWLYNQRDVASAVVVL